MDGAALAGFSCKAFSKKSQKRNTSWFLWILDIYFTTVQNKKVIFFSQKLEDTSLFCGVIDTPVLAFWWCLPWVSNVGWIPCLHAFSPVWSSESDSGWHLLTVQMSAWQIRFLIHILAELVSTSIGEVQTHDCAYSSTTLSTNRPLRVHKKVKFTEHCPQISVQWSYSDK